MKTGKRTEKTAVSRRAIQDLADNRLDSRRAAEVYAKIMADRASRVFYNKIMAQKVLLARWYLSCMTQH